MKLSEYKFEKKEDYNVIKALIRCAKESGEYYKIEFGNCKKLIDKCYLSRHAHKTESFFTNICYWPGDCGIRLSNVIRLLYYSLVVCELDFDKPNTITHNFCKTLADFLNTLSVAKNEDFNKIFLYKKIISNAIDKLSKIGELKKINSESFFEDVLLIDKGRMIGIPF